MEDKRKRIPTSVAAERLGVSPATVLDYMRRGYLTGTTTTGERSEVGGWYWFDPAEVDAFARGAAPAAKAYRESRETNGTPKRGRKVGAR